MLSHNHNDTIKHFNYILTLFYQKGHTRGESIVVGKGVKENGSLTKNDNEKAEVLNSFFKSVFTVEDTSQLPEPQGMKVDQVLSTVEITPLIVKNKLLKLNKSKSTGPDLIHPWVLSETAGSICIPLAMIFTKSMEQGIVPSSWKQAHVNAIFKRVIEKKQKITDLSV